MINLLLIYDSIKNTDKVDARKEKACSKGASCHLCGYKAKGSVSYAYIL